jgi:hypothetical protein
MIRKRSSIISLEIYLWQYNSHFSIGVFCFPEKKIVYLTVFGFEALFFEFFELFLEAF